MKLASLLPLLFVSFSLSAQQWQTISSVPSIGRDDGLAFAIGSYGYVVTGNQNGFSESNKLFQYDPTTDSWAERAIFPGTARQYSACFVLKNDAYIIGGYSESGQALKDVWQYSATTDSWNQRTDFPGLARWHATGVSIGEKGYFGMGTCADSTLADFWKFNPMTDQWTQLNDYPGGGQRSVLGLPILDNIICGEGFSINPTSYSDAWFQFDTKTEIWSEFTSFPGGKRSYGTAISNGLTAIVCGGMNDNSAFQNDCYALDYKGEWTTLPNLPMTGLRGAKGFYLNSSFYLGTGIDNVFVRRSDFNKIQIMPSHDDEPLIFPNPSYDSFTIVSEPLSMIKVYTLSGKLIKSTTINDAGFVQLQDLPIGIYVVSIEGTEVFEVKKIVKL